MKILFTKCPCLSVCLSACQSVCLHAVSDEVFLVSTGEGLTKNRSPLRVQTIVTKTKFTVPDSVVNNGGKMPLRPDKLDLPPSPKPRKIKRTKSRDEPHTKPRPKKLATPRAGSGSLASNELLPNMVNGFPPTPLESSAFIMPSPKENFFPGHNAIPQAPVLTPPVSPAVSSCMPRNSLPGNNHVHVTYTGFSSSKQSCAYSINGDVSPSADMIDKLVAQHFNSCGLGGFVGSARYQSSPSCGNPQYPQRQVSGLGRIVLKGEGFVLFLEASEVNSCARSGIDFILKLRSSLGQSIALRELYETGPRAELSEELSSVRSYSGSYIMKPTPGREFTKSNRGIRIFFGSLELRSKNHRSSKRVVNQNLVLNL